jgi:hypothetical protein
MIYGCYHECPECGDVCYCDGEDHHACDDADCCHDCEERDDDDE